MKIYLVYVKNKYPEYNEPNRYLNSIWTDEMEMYAVLRKQSADYPALYDKDMIDIEICESDKFNEVL